MDEQSSQSSRKSSVMGKVDLAEARMSPYRTRSRKNSNLTEENLAMHNDSPVTRGALRRSTRRLSQGSENQNTVVLTPMPLATKRTTRRSPSVTSGDDVNVTPKKKFSVAKENDLMEEDEGEDDNEVKSSSPAENGSSDVSKETVSTMINGNVTNVTKEQTNQDAKKTATEEATPIESKKVSKAVDRSSTDKPIKLNRSSTVKSTVSSNLELKVSNASTTEDSTTTSKPLDPAVSAIDINEITKNKEAKGSVTVTPVNKPFSLVDVTSSVENVVLYTSQMITKAEENVVSTNVSSKLEEVVAPSMDERKMDISGIINLDDTVFEMDSPAKPDISQSDVPNTPITPKKSTDVSIIPKTPLQNEKSSATDEVIPGTPQPNPKTSIDVASPKTPLSIQKSSTAEIFVPETPQPVEKTLTDEKPIAETPTDKKPISASPKTPLSTQKSSTAKSFVPETQKPVEKTLADEKPIAETPTDKKPVSASPKTPLSIQKSSTAEIFVPQTPEPVEKTLADDKPIAETPTDKKSISASPKTPLSIQKSSTAESVVPETTQPIAETQTDKKPIAETQTDKEPIAETPTDKEPVAETPTDKKPIAETPTDDKSIVETPASNTEPIVNLNILNVKESEEEILLKTPPKTPSKTSNPTESESTISNITLNPADSTTKSDETTSKTEPSITPLKEGTTDADDEYPKWGGAIHRKSDGQPIDKFGINQTKEVATLTVEKSSKNISIVSLRDSSEEDSGSENESRNEFLDDEAMESDGEPSMDEEERQYLQENEIPEDGISIGSEDSEIEISDDNESNDSFIVSDTSIQLLDDSGDDLNFCNDSSELNKSQNKSMRGNKICDTSDEELELEKSPRKSSPSKRRSDTSLKNSAKQSKLDTTDRRRNKISESGDEDELANLDVEQKKTTRSKRMSESLAPSKKEVKRPSLLPNVKLCSVEEILKPKPKQHQIKQTNGKVREIQIEEVNLTVEDSNDENVAEQLASLDDEPKKTTSSKRFSESLSLSKKELKRRSLHPNMKLSSQESKEEEKQVPSAVESSNDEDVAEQLASLDDEPKKTTSSKRFSESLSLSKKELKRRSLHPNMKLSSQESKEEEKQVPSAVESSNDEDVAEQLASLDDEPKKTTRSKRLSESSPLTKKELKRRSLHPNTKLSSVESTEEQDKSTIDVNQPNITKEDATEEQVDEDAELKKSINNENDAKVDEGIVDDVKEELANLDAKPKKNKKSKRLSDSMPKKDVKRLSLHPNTKLDAGLKIQEEQSKSNEGIVNSEPSTVPESGPLNDVEEMDVDQSHNLTNSAPTTSQHKAGIQHSFDEIQEKCDAFLQLAQEAKRQEKLKNKVMQEDKYQRLKEKKAAKLQEKKEKEARRLESEELAAKQRQLKREKKLKPVEVTEEEKTKAIDKAMAFSQKILAQKIKHSKIVEAEPVEKPIEETTSAVKSGKRKRKLLQILDNGQNTTKRVKRSENEQIPAKRSENEQIPAKPEGFKINSLPVKQKKVAKPKKIQSTTAGAFEVETVLMKPARSPFAVATLDSPSFPINKFKETSIFNSKVPRESAAELLRRKKMQKKLQKR